MSEKYIDLADRIKRGHGDDEVREGIDYALHWLDAHRDQVPGRTITASQYSAATRYMNAGDQATFASGFALAGGSLVPDPELPTEPGSVVRTRGDGEDYTLGRDLNWRYGRSVVQPADLRQLDWEVVA